MYESKYFKVEDMDHCDCPCCGLFRWSDRLSEMMDTAREHAGVPFFITSGTRCWTHNEEVGGSKTSSHIPLDDNGVYNEEDGESTAVDIATENSVHRFKVLDSLFYAGFNRIGLGKNFIHADCDPLKDGGVVWTYYGK